MLESLFRIDDSVIADQLANTLQGVLKCDGLGLLGLLRRSPLGAPQLGEVEVILLSIKRAVVLFPLLVLGVELFVCHHDILELLPRWTQCR